MCGVVAYLLFEYPPDFIQQKMFDDFSAGATRANTGLVTLRSFSDRQGCCSLHARQAFLAAPGRGAPSRRPRTEAWSWRPDRAVPGVERWPANVSHDLREAPKVAHVSFAIVPLEWKETKQYA